MLTIKAPETYINEENSILLSGEILSKIGSFALIIGGERALQEAGHHLLSSLDEAHITYQVETFTGYCTTEQIDQYSEIAKDLGVDVIVGVGGGKVLDLAKAVAERETLPVVTIPTIAATCAAWSSLSVLYTDSGVSSGFLLLQSTPKAVIVDPNILIKSPVRYLQAGIADTIVKWYEYVPYANPDEYQVSLNISLNTAKHALAILEEHSLQAIEDNKIGHVSKEFKEVVDAIIALAGLVGSTSDSKPRLPVAHAIHNSITAIPETKSILHGEKVIFGLIAQFLLEKKPQSEITEFIDKLTELNLPVTLNQLNLKDDLPTTIKAIANGVRLNKQATVDLPFEFEHHLIEAHE